MKASELIKELEKKMQYLGDVEVYEGYSGEKIQAVLGFPGVNSSEPFIEIE